MKDLPQAQIVEKNPNRELFSGGAPGGESPAEVARRPARVVERIAMWRAVSSLFSSVHFIRLFTARWLGVLAGSSGGKSAEAGYLSAVSDGHNLSRPVIRLSNDDHPVGL